jgi:hypothetical protein
MEAKTPSITLETNYGTISRMICIIINKAMRTTKYRKRYISSIYEHSGSKLFEPESNAKVFFCPIFHDIL